MLIYEDRNNLLMYISKILDNDEKRGTIIIQALKESPSLITGTILANLQMLGKHF